MLGCVLCYKKNVIKQWIFKIHARQVRALQLKEEMEKSRVLQEALHALATEHHELEQSIAVRKPSTQRYYDTDEDEFYDCDEENLENTEEFPVHGTFKEDVECMSYQSIKCESPDLSIQSITEKSKYGRTKLPVPMFDRNDFSVWTILKQCIGKELSKITMPVVFNEPISFLQRITEYMEYSELLENACLCNDPVDRLKYISAFAASAISSNFERLGKPFNPLLGETFEFNRPDLGFKVVSEQVSHHPPVSAFHVESPNYKFHGSIHPKLKFWGKSVEVNPKGVLTLELTKHGETYTWSNVNCCVHNVIVGKLWVEHYGVQEIVNHKTKHKAVLNYKQGGWFGKDLHKIEGCIYTPDKKKVKALYGSWAKELFAVDVGDYEEFMKDFNSGTSPSHHAKPLNGASSDGDVSDDIPVKSPSTYDLQIPGQEVIWTGVPRPEYSQEYFSFTLFTMALNEITQENASQISPTDSRLRPDIRLLEQGQIDLASAEKNRLEEKQRAARKERKKRKEEWSPLWFSYGTNQITGKEDWLFKGEYWKKDWSKCPDIF